MQPSNTGRRGLFDVAAGVSVAHDTPRLPVREGVRCLAQSRPMSDTTGNLLGQAASLDPAIRERVINLANLALDRAEFLMRHGDPIMQGKLLQSFMTTFAQHMRTQDTNDELEKLRQDLAELTAAVRGHTAGNDDTIIDGDEDIEEAMVVDMPPGSPPMIRSV